MCAYDLFDHSGWKKMLAGWVLAAVNSVDHLRHWVLEQLSLAFVPANLFCIVLYAANLRILAQSRGILNPAILSANHQ